MNSNLDFFLKLKFLVFSLQTITMATTSGMSWKTQRQITKVIQTSSQVVFRWRISPRISISSSFFTLPWKSRHSRWRRWGGAGNSNEGSCITFRWLWEAVSGLKIQQDIFFLNQKSFFRRLDESFKWSDEKRDKKLFSLQYQIAFQARKFQKLWKIKLFTSKREARDDGNLSLWRN